MDRPSVLHAALETTRFDARQSCVAITLGFHHERMIHMPAVAVFLRQPKPTARKSLPVPGSNVAAAADPAVDSGKLQPKNCRVNFIEPRIVAVPLGIVGPFHAIET